MCADLLPLSSYGYGAELIVQLLLANNKTCLGCLTRTFVNLRTVSRQGVTKLTGGTLTDGVEFFLLQARSRSSASSRAATGGSRTARTGRSIHTFTRRTSHTTVGCRVAIRATHIRVRCENIWKCTVVGPVQLARALPLATTVMAVTPTALQLHPSASRQQVAVLQARVPHPQTNTTIIITTTQTTLPRAIQPRPSTNNTTP